MFFKQLRNQLAVSEVIIDKLIRELNEVYGKMEVLEDRMILLSDKLLTQEKSSSSKKKKVE